jgi:hypothetical protein
MPIESSVTLISDLNVLYPDNNDAKALGANHVRNVKVALLSLNTASATKGAAQVGFLQSGSGTASRTVQQRLRDTVSIADFTGADPTGTTSSSAAFTAAVAALGANGGEIYIPAGDWLLSTTVTVLASGVRFRGASAASTRIINGQTNAPAITFGDGITTYTRCGISSVVFGQKSGVVAVAGNYGLYVVLQSNFYCQEVQVYNFPGAPYRGLGFVSVSQSYINHLGVQGCLDNGIYFSLCSDLRVVSCRSDSNGGHGFLLDGNVGNIHVACSAYNNTLSGWRYGSASPATVPNKWNWFDCCFADTNGSYNWSISDSNNSYWVACWGATQISTGVNVGATGFYIETSNCNGLTFIGGMALYNNADGVYINATVSSPTGLVFTSNFEFGNSVNGNGRSGTGYGLQVSTGFTGTLRVRDCSFAGNATGSYLNNTGATADIIISGCVGQRNLGRTSNAQGTAVASANNLVLPKDGTYFQVSGATQINLIDNTGWNGGDTVTLKFNSTPVVKCNFTVSGNNKPLIILGNADFSATASDLLTLRYDSTDSAWYEQSRSVN